MLTPHLSIGTVRACITLHDNDPWECRDQSQKSVDWMLARLLLRGLAMTHAQSRCRLLRDWDARKSEHSASETQSRNSENESIEEELLQAYQRLDIQVMPVLKLWLLGPYYNGSNSGAEEMDHMPQLFSTWEETSDCWALIMRRVMHIVHSVVGVEKLPMNGSDYKATFHHTDPAPSVAKLGEMDRRSEST